MGTESAAPKLTLMKDVEYTGGPSGATQTFTVVNSGTKEAVRARFSIIGVNYKWSPEPKPPAGLTLRPGDRRSIRYPLSEELPYRRDIHGLAFEMKYSDLDGRSYRETAHLQQTRVPSGAFYILKVKERQAPKTIAYLQILRTLSTASSDGWVTSRDFWASAAERGLYPETYLPSEESVTERLRADGLIEFSHTFKGDAQGPYGSARLTADGERQLREWDQGDDVLSAQ